MDECPNCGDTKHTWQNSSGELQCDNCGYDECNDEDNLMDDLWD